MSGSNEEDFKNQRELRTRVKTRPIFLSKILSRFSIVSSGVLLKERVWMTNCERGNAFSLPPGLDHGSQLVRTSLMCWFNFAYSQSTSASICVRLGWFS
jgi:hypothetical protein